MKKNAGWSAARVAEVGCPHRSREILGDAAADMRADLPRSRYEVVGDPGHALGGEVVTDTQQGNEQARLAVAVEHRNSHDVQFRPVFAVDRPVTLCPELLELIG